MTNWSLTDIPDQSGRTVAVTGANSGLGYAATEAFVHRGADVVMACRSVDRAREAAEEISVPEADGSLTVMELDLGDLGSVRSFAAAYEREFDDLHILCNNAGVMATPYRTTEDGFELQFGVNHLGHFALTGLLLDSLQETPGETRVVTHSSAMHERGQMDFDDLQHEQSYDKWEAYAQSKLANALFGFELDRRLRAAGESVTSVVCHPGYADTNLQRRGPEMAGSRLRLLAMQAANAVVGQSARQGALPLLYAATAEAIDGGEYVGPGGLFNMRGAPEVREPAAQAQDADAAQRLWAVSEELTNVAYRLAEPSATE
ncbi:oxidoreductase [Halolamina sp.]|uniref:oxidoreductase n=1 Tax=Halolamina sp. TaxID=1940283 RepID=UPI000223B868|nr:short-chain dehydrogenase/reductase SDR [halophilic archaeon DL31]